MTRTTIRTRLNALADPGKAKQLQRFFKTGPGEYGEGDIFLGITVPVLRQLAREAEALPLAEVIALLRSPLHEERFLALVLLVTRYHKAPSGDKRIFYDVYCHHTAFVNNWDLVDASALHIVGDYLLDKDKAPLYAFARSANLWERRIAIVATFHFIRRNHFAPTLEIATLLLDDREDLIHKAVGWMLREVGKRNLELTEEFLDRHHQRMPRVMLRYAIEKFPETTRKMYLRPRLVPQP